MKLYIERLGTNKLDMKIDHFTKMLFDRLGGIYGSVAVEATYLDNSFLEPQCRNRRRRSIDDLILIYRTYLGNIRIKTILESLERIILSPKKGALLFCPDANRWVLHEYLGGTHIGKKIYTRYYQNGEFDQYTGSGSGKITLKYVLDTLGFKNHNC